MRTLARNKRTFYYCLYKGKAPILDVNDYETGDYLITYYDPIQMKGNISAVKGDSQPDLFGNDISYDSVIVIDDLKCPIDENTVLFIDKQPEFDSLNTPKYDYVVSKVAKSLNSISIAILRVK